MTPPPYWDPLVPGASTAPASRSTNAIKNPNGSVERHTRNVKRWGGADMIQRWVTHRSGRRYQPFDFRQSDAIATDEFEPLPDVDARRNEFRIVTWDLEPGDAVIFSALTLHGATGNDTWDRRRRALSIRYTGDDARFIKRWKIRTKFP